MSYALVNVDKPVNSSMPGAGGGKKDKILVFRMDDVLSFPARDSKGVKITGNITFKPGHDMITLYATPSSMVITQKSVGDEDAKGFEQELKINHPGSEKDIQEFVANNLNQNLGAIVRYCASGKQKLLGTQCAPLQIETTQTDDKDKNVTEITFKSSQKGDCIAWYEGTLDYDSGSGAV